MTSRFQRLLPLVPVLLCLGTVDARAQGPGGAALRPGETASARPGILSRIGIDQRLNTQVPLEIPFVDETGRHVRLGDFFGSRPVILALVYYECPMLCTQVLNGLVSALGDAKPR